MRRYSGYIITIIAACLAAAPRMALAQESSVEEIVVSFDVPQLLSQDLFVRYDGKTIYLPLLELFNILELNIDADLRSGKLSGYVISRDRKFQLDLKTATARILGKEFQFDSKGYIQEGSEIFLRIDLFKEFFDLNMEFYFSALRVYLPLNKDYPAYQKLKRKMDHERLLQKISESKDVMTLPRRREFISGGALDWSLSASPFGNGGQYFDFNLGGMLFGGDIAIAGSGNSVSGFIPANTLYKWHRYIDHNNYLTQIDIGNINTSGPLSRALKGGMITNKPQIERKYFQTISLNDHVGRGWEVELYIDQKLTAFQYTDEEGDYNFNIDIFYGTSLVTLKMYGPYGEIRTEETYIRIPYNLIPEKSLEYSLAWGKSSVFDEPKKYIQGSTFYGVSNHWTLGAIFDIPMGLQDGEQPSFAGQSTYQMGRNLTFDISIAPDYMTRFSTNYSKLTLLNINAGYAAFQKNEFKNRLNQIHSLMFSLSSPLRLGGRYLGLRYNASWDKYRTADYINMNYGFNFSLSRFQLNYMGKYKISVYRNRSLTNMTSQVLLSALSIPWVQPQVRGVFDHQQKKPISYGLILNKRLFKTGQLSFSFERNLSARTDLMMLTFNFFAPFANFTSRLLSSERSTSMSQMQRGSIRYDSRTSSFHFDRRTAVGFGSAVIRPFRDDNLNGIRDGSEEYFPGIRAKITGGREHPTGRNSMYYYDGLRPYEDYVIQIDQNSIDNPQLKPAHENYKVSCSPNVVTAIEVPLVSTGEAGGIVERQTPEGKNGVGGVRVMIMNLTTDALAEITAFSSGEFFYEGLIPGRYKAYVDPEQLTRYGYISQPEAIEFEIKAAEVGKIKADLNFLLIPKEQKIAQ